jgi:prevent-host-death family protein
MSRESAVTYITALSRVLLRGTGARPAANNASGKVNAAVFRRMASQLEDFGHPKILPSVSTNELRDNLSETINRAAFGEDPVLVTRRGRRIAAIISIVDLVFLERMKKRKYEAMKENLPADQSLVGPAMARRLYQELFFG